MEAQRAHLQPTADSFTSISEVKNHHDMASICWLESTQRQCLPSLVHARAHAGDTRHARCNLSALATTEVTQSPHPNQTASGGDASAGGGGGGGSGDDMEMTSVGFPAASAAAAAAAQADILDVMRSTLLPNTLLPRRKIISLSQRWRPYVNGAIKRYSVPPRIYSVLRDDGNASIPPVRSLQEMADCLAEEKKNRRLQRDEFAPQTTLPRQLLVRPTDEDPRQAFGDMSVRWKAPDAVDIPLGVLGRTRLFGVTLGAVRPYALGDNGEVKEQRLRCGRVQAPMPPSALTGDPMAVFAEVMRYQRPTVGVYTFDVN